MQMSRNVLRRGRTRVVAAVVAAATVLAPAAAMADSSSSTPAPAASSAGPVFTVGLTNDVDSMNPFVGIVATSFEVWGMIYDTLTGYGQKDYSPVPGLATSWSTSPDGLTWTFHLRSGVKWSDGVPLTAHDAAYTFNRIMKNSFEQTNYGNYVANMTSVTAPDDTTLIIKTSKPSPIMLHLAVPILPEHIWSKIDEKAVQTFPNNKDVVGSGPFTFIQWQVGQFIRLKANPDYWGGAPKVGEVDFRIFKNDDAMVQALRKGEIDFIDNLSANLYDSLKGAQGITLVDAKYAGFEEVGMNNGAATDTGTPIGNGNPALKNVLVRKAINYAIDRQTLVDKVIRGYGSVGTSVIPPIYADQHYQPTTDLMGYDPTKAKALLDQAGYKMGPSGVRVGPDGKPLTLRFFARQESQDSQQVAQFVKGWLKDVGINVVITVMAENRLTDVIGNGEYDLFEWGWVVEPDPDFQLSVFTCGQRSTKDGSTITAGLSDSFFCDPTYDKLYAEQQVTVDPAQRDAIVKSAEKVVYDKAAYALTYYYDDLEAYRSDRWTNLQPQPDPGGSLIFQYGTYTYRNVEPVSVAQASASATPGSTGVASAPTSRSGSSATAVLLGVLAVLVLGGGAFALIRRRGSADDRE